MEGSKISSFQTRITHPGPRRTPLHLSFGFHITKQPKSTQDQRFPGNLRSLLDGFVSTIQWPCALSPAMFLAINKTEVPISEAPTDPSISPAQRCQSCSIYRFLIWKLLLFPKGENTAGLRSAKPLQLHPLFFRFLGFYRSIDFCLYYCLATPTIAAMPKLQSRRAPKSPAVSVTF